MQFRPARAAPSSLDSLPPLPGAGAWSDGNDSDDAPPPATFDALPPDVISLVFRRLDPITLARAACVNREWRAAAASDALWLPHCTAVCGGRRHGGPSTGRAAEPGPGGSDKSGPPAGSISGSNEGRHPDLGCRQRFAAAARERPRLLLRWRSNRVLVGGKLGWLADGHPPGGAPCRHLTAEAVLAYLRPGGRLRGGDGSSSGSGSGSEGGASDAEATNRRLRFWQL